MYANYCAYNKLLTMLKIADKDCQDIFLQVKNYVHLYYKHIKTKFELIWTCQIMSGQYQLLYHEPQ